MFWSRNKEVRTSKRETIKVTPIIPVYFSNIGIRSLSSTHYFQLRVLPIKPNTIVSWLASSTSEASILQERLSWPPPPPRFLHHGSGQLNFEWEAQCLKVVDSKEMPFTGNDFSSVSVFIDRHKAEEEEEGGGPCEQDLFIYLWKIARLSLKQVLSGLSINDLA